jgi:hypothetical protein
MRIGALQPAKICTVANSLASNEEAHLVLLSGLLGKRYIRTRENGER